MRVGNKFVVRKHGFMGKESPLHEASHDKEVFGTFSVVINFIVYGALNHLCNDRNGCRDDLQS